jgi:hypothetical protein
MYLPMQREPVQRRLAGQPCAHQTGNPGNDPNADANGQSFRGGEYGVQPSGVDWSQVVNTGLGILSSFL